MQRIWRLNGENITYDYDLTSLDKALIEPGIVEWLEVKDSKVTKWKAFIKVRRWEKDVMVNFENTQDLEINTSNYWKIFIEIDQEKINSWFNNNPDWSWIWEIKISENYPILNSFLALAEIENGEIVDKRKFIKFRDFFNLTTKWNDFNKENSLVKLDENWDFPELEASKLKTKNYLETSLIAWEDIKKGDFIYMEKVSWKALKASWEDLEKSDILWVAKKDALEWEKVEIIFYWEANLFENLEIWKDYFLWDALSSYTKEVSKEAFWSQYGQPSLNFLNSYWENKFLSQEINLAKEIKIWRLNLVLRRVWNAQFYIKAKIMKKSDNSIVAESKNKILSSNISTTFSSKEFLFNLEVLSNLEKWAYYIRLEDDKISFDNTNYVVWWFNFWVVEWEKWYLMKDENTFVSNWWYFNYSLESWEKQSVIWKTPWTIEKKVWRAIWENKMIIKTV